MIQTHTRIVNFLGAPGVGKSTQAVGLFYNMKREGLSVEYIGEYAKDVTYDDNKRLLEDQWHIFSQQLRRQYRLIDKVDYVITDSPLLLSAVYLRWLEEVNSHHVFDRDFRMKSYQYFIDCYHQFNNVNFYITRTVPYKSEGRVHTQEESVLLDYMINEIATEECKDTNLKNISPLTPMSEIIRTVRAR